MKEKKVALVRGIQTKHHHLYGMIKQIVFIALVVVVIMVSLIYI